MFGITTPDAEVVHACSRTYTCCLAFGVSSRLRRGFFRIALSGHVGGVLEVRGGVSCAFTVVGR